MFQPAMLGCAEVADGTRQLAQTSTKIATGLNIARGRRTRSEAYHERRNSLRTSPSRKIDPATVTCELTRHARASAAAGASSIATGMVGSRRATVSASAAGSAERLVGARVRT